MTACLTDPRHGYYTTRKHIFGAKGDFTTSPHISPVFADLLAVWIAHFIRSHSHTRYNLIELGPGSGALLKSLLPALSRLRAAPDTIKLLEASPQLMEAQRQALKDHKVSWASSLEEVLQFATGTQLPTFILAQEFLDALPVHVLHRVRKGLYRERLVDIAEHASIQEPALRFVLASTDTPGLRLLELVGGEGDVVEVCAEAVSVVERLANVVSKVGGAAVLVDYGGMQVDGETVRALRRHAEIGLLEAPGDCDVTADVNFKQLETAVANVDGVDMWGPVEQGEFLLKLGAAERFRRLGREVLATGETDEVVDLRLKNLQADYDRLVGKGQGGMGRLYKVAIVSRVEDGIPFAMRDR